MFALPTPRPQAGQKIPASKLSGKLSAFSKSRWKSRAFVAKNPRTAAFVEMRKNSSLPVRKLLPGCRFLKDYLRASVVNAVPHFLFGFPRD
jgi:hypothetical protein